MKWTRYFLLASACVCIQSDAFAQGITKSELEKYPDIAHRLRAFELFRFLEADKQGAKGHKPVGDEFDTMNRAVTVICLELNDAGVFVSLDKPFPKEKLERLSPAARVFYEYYRQAMPKNPVFRDIFKPLPANKSQLYLAYRKHRLEACSEDERRAYEAAAKILDEIVGGHPHRFPWVWTAAGLAAPLMAGGVFVMYRRRGKKAAAKPTNA